MAAFRLDTAAAIRKLEGAGVDERQAAAIVDLHAVADADLVTTTDLELTRTELKADLENLSQRVDANQQILSQQLETGLADLGTTIANANTEQQRRFNVLLGSMIAVAALILAGMAVF